MQARGPLMIEHRLIERMIALAGEAVSRIRTEESVDPVFIDKMVDFIRLYADRTHHGKEENILFRDLEKKAMSGEDRRMMEELIEEHILGRKTTQALVEANQRYREGDRSALSDIAAAMGRLIEFYPKHIEKEDKIFFPAVRAYFSDAEEQKMLSEFWEFDRQMIHEKYRRDVENLEES